MKPDVYTSLDDPAWQRYFTDFDYSAWRLETLQAADVPAERAAFAQFQQYGAQAAHQAIDEAMAPWTEGVVAPSVTAGKTIGRVHIVENDDVDAETPVFSDYLNYKMAAYRRSAAAGEDIRLIVTDADTWPVDIPEGPEDFWLFDSSTLMEMRYTDTGVFARAVVHTIHTYPSAIVRAGRIRDAALAQSKPFYP